MRRRLTALLLGSGAAALALSLGTSTAIASSVNAGWTVRPGGNFSFTGSGQVKDATTGAVAKCRVIKLSGTLLAASNGMPIGTITSASFAGCTIATITITVTAHGLPWKLNATSYNALTGVTTGNITGIDLVASAPSCSATLDGTGAGKNNGKTKITYTNSTGQIKLLATGGNLHSYNVSGCFGLVNNNDVQQASGSGTVTPKQTITSP